MKTFYFTEPDSVMMEFARPFSPPHPYPSEEIISRSRPESKIPRPAYGIPRLELFSVIIHKIAGENPTDDLYGTITVFDSLGELDIYTRERGYCKPIHLGDDLLLTGPHRSILALGPIDIVMNLKNKNGVHPSPIKMCTRLNATGLNPSYDKPLGVTIDGQFGSVTLKYAVFGNSVGAKVEVMVLNMSLSQPQEKSAIDVYGHITARNSMFKDKIQSVLFAEDYRGCIPVRPGEHIPLSRSVVALPVTSSLILHLDLWDAGTSFLLPNVTFQAQSEGISKRLIFCSFALIHVKACSCRFNYLPLCLHSNAPGQATQEDATEGTRVNVAGQNQAGNGVHFRHAFPSQQFYPMPQVMQVPMTRAAAPNPSPLSFIFQPIRDSLSIMSEFMNCMELEFSQIGNQSNSSPTARDPSTVELPSNAHGLPTATPKALSIVLQQAHRLFSEHAVAALSIIYLFKLRSF